MTSEPQRIIGPFEIHKRIGVGGMGIVYKGIYSKTGLPVAIKILSPDLSNEESLQLRFEREVSILKKLKHPNVVRYYASGKIGMQRFYAMEYVPGGSLEVLLKKKTKFPWEEVVSLTMQIAQALEYAHAAGVIHRDLKPANLLLAPDGVLKLTDFGIARDTTATALTAAGRTVGTYAYMAPEQIRGKPPVDRKTDLYALGCVMFEMLTGETPFHSENGGETMMMHMNEPPPRVTSLVSDVPLWLETLIFDLLEKDPNERPYDALAVHTRLEESLARATAQTSVVQMLSEGGNLGATVLTADVKDALKPAKKKKKKSSGPVYEQTWFLAMCLMGIVAGVGWLMMPASPQKLLEQGRALYQTANEDRREVDWMTARDKFLKPLVERHPNSEQALAAREMLDEIEAAGLEKRIRNKMRLNRDPENESERLLMEAFRYDTFGDRISAASNFDHVINLLKGNEKDKSYLLLAQKKRAAITDSVKGLDRIDLVNSNLQRAEEMLKEGKTLAAREIWNSITRLYANDQEMAPLVSVARNRLMGKESSPGHPDAPTNSPQEVKTIEN